MNSFPENLFTMHAFDYEAPKTLRDALQLLGRHNGSARPLAGGTDLIDQMRVGRLTPGVVVDLKKITELNVLHSDENGLHIGAAVPCCKIYSDPIVTKQYTALSDSCHVIGGIQIQSRASLGGNLCNSGPAADSTPSMIALGGVCVIAGPNGNREVPVESFCTGPGKNVLQPGELLVEIRFPKPPAQSGSHYRRMIPRNEMDIAIAVDGLGHARLGVEPGAQSADGEQRGHRSREYSFGSNASRTASPTKTTRSNVTKRTPSG